MGKTGKWLKNFLKGKKDTEKEKQKSAYDQNSSNPTENPTTPISTTSKEKRRWSFGRSSATATVSKELNSKDQSNGSASVTLQTAADAENEPGKHAMAMAATTAAAIADRAVVAAEAAVAVIHLTSGSNGNAGSIEEAAAIKIQSTFRSYLARKALCALRGLVKLQALVRGHLVRKQATAALRCMMALVTAQAKARAHRIRASESKPNQRQSTHKKSTQDNYLRHIYDEIDRVMEENIKIMEMDVCQLKSNSRSRNNFTNQTQQEKSEHRISTYFLSSNIHSKEESYKVSPAPSALTEFNPRASNSHFEDCAFSTAQSSPQNHSAMSYDYPLNPNYMANTKSSRAKARSQSAPKQRPETFERQLSQRKASVEGRNVPKPARMQRSSSHVGVTSQNYQFPWSIKLDRSIVSFIESECGSTSTALTNTNYRKSLAS